MSIELKVGDKIKLRPRRFGERLIYGSESTKPINGGEEGTIASFGMRDIDVRIEGHGFVRVTIHDLDTPTTPTQKGT